MEIFVNEGIGTVTILILIDGFLQSPVILLQILNYQSHNPYFNRWFSAIETR